MKNNYKLNMLNMNIKRKITWLCTASTLLRYGKKVKLEFGFITI